MEGRDRSQEGRLEEVERRLAALEARLAENDPVDAPPADQDDRFWALSGLKDRAGERGAVVFAGALTTEDGAGYEWQHGMLADDLLGELADADDMTQFTDVLAALAQPVRLRLLLAVLNGRHTSAELGSIDGSGTTGQLYHHLRQLVAAGWLRSAGRGQYQIPPERVIPLLVALAAARR